MHKLTTPKKNKGGNANQYGQQEAKILIAMNAQRVRDYQKSPTLKSRFAQINKPKKKQKKKNTRILSIWHTYKFMGIMPPAREKLLTNIKIAMKCGQQAHIP